MSEARATGEPRRLDGVILAVVALGVYVLLWQATFYTTDGHFILIRLEEGKAIHNAHYLYMPLLMVLVDALSFTGLDARQTALLYSSLGTAIGVWIAHLICRRAGMGRLTALLTAGLVAAMPPVLFFATVVEFHGPYFAAAQLAFLAAVLLAERPTAVRALAVGAAGALAFCFHTSALVLPGLLVPWFFASRRDAGHAWTRRDIALGGLSGVAHFGFLWLSLQVLQALGFPEFPPAYDEGRLRGVTLSTLQWVPEIFWQEWGGPYLPASIIALLTVFFAPVRYRWGAFVLGLVAFLIPSLVLLTGRPELGAYTLPVAMPAALLIGHVASRRPVVLGAVVAVSLALAVAQVWQRDVDGPRYRAYAEGIVELADGAPVAVIIAEDLELGACLVEMPEVPRFLITQLAVMPAEVVEPQLAALPAYVQPFWTEGRQVFFSTHAEEYLRDPVKRPSGPLLVRGMHQHFRLEPVEAAGFRGYRVLPLQ